MNNFAILITACVLESDLFSADQTEEVAPRTFFAVWGFQSALNHK